MPFFHGFPDALCFFGELFVSLLGEFLSLFGGYAKSFWFWGFWGWGGAVECVGEVFYDSFSPFH